MIERKILDLLREVSRANSIDEALGLITTKACKLVGGHGGSVWLRDFSDPNKVVLQWTYRLDGPNEVGISNYSGIPDEDGFYEGLTGWVFGTGKPLRLKDISDETELQEYKGLKWSDKYKGYAHSVDHERQKRFLAVPIFSCRDNRVIGVLRIGASISPEPFTADHENILRSVSDHISGILTNDLRRKAERDLFERLIGVVTRADLATLFSEIAHNLPAVVNGSYCSIFIQKEDGNFCLEATSAEHLYPYLYSKNDTNYLRYAPGEGKTGLVAQTGESINRWGNIKSEAGKRSDLCECRDESSAFLATAIKHGDGAPRGVIRVVRDLETHKKFDDEDQRFLENLSEKLFEAYLRITEYSFLRQSSEFVEIIKKIRTSTEYLDTGLFLFNYFAEVLRQRHPELNEVEVITSQKRFSYRNDLEIKVRIPVPLARWGVVEKTLKQYGYFIKGAISPGDFFQNPQDALDWKQRSERAYMDFVHRQEQFNFQAGRLNQSTSREKDKALNQFSQQFFEVFTEPQGVVKELRQISEDPGFQDRADLLNSLELVASILEDKETRVEKLEPGRIKAALEMIQGEIPADFQKVRNYLREVSRYAQQEQPRWLGLLLEIIEDLD